MRSCWLLTPRAPAILEVDSSAASSPRRWVED
ncbi:hypothetical protein PC128_g8077 [Phytophthora cactorum]|nr:hypothetical protein C6341_g26121 [Phytophthora cactorum]KAG3195911.1 hypothetical protein PC128_g8077 [Phytophthora cactorum]